MGETITVMPPETVEFPLSLQIILYKSDEAQRTDKFMPTRLSSVPFPYPAASHASSPPSMFHAAPVT